MTLRTARRILDWTNRIGLALTAAALIGYWIGFFALTWF